MTHEAFIKLVAQMRTTQKSYFRTRQKDPVSARTILQESKRLEREVDAELERLRLEAAGIGEQGNIFG